MFAPLFSASSQVSDRTGSALSLLVRLAFASVLLPFFLNSLLTKVDGFGLSTGAYVQILPTYMESVGYDASQVPVALKLVVLAGTLAELALPLMILIGLGTRLAAFGMIGFVAVMSLTDIYGHGIDAATVGAFFDTDPYGLIADQRLLWAVLMVMLMVVGGGRLSADAFVSRWLRSASVPAHA
ncbi:DoxX family protein (plasmid) [Pseudorhodobacter turbinis]|uniref:DoxX family protein n=2 Tax=Pseudorhodobacter turbinis TaxID=2500533 RepID=A0A4P8ELB1_9RHOB|nr:DoxX family protein [Pseudorhodobacter turbinis]